MAANSGGAVDTMRALSLLRNWAVGAEWHPCRPPRGGGPQVLRQAPHPRRGAPPRPARELDKLAAAL